MNQYFASKPVTELIPELSRRIDEYLRHLLNSGRLAQWRIANDTYHGSRGKHNSTYITAGGKQGELSFLLANDYRNLVQYGIKYATQVRPAISCIAINNDVKSQAATILGDALIENYLKQSEFEERLRYAVEMASAVYDLTWVFPLWDLNMGEDAVVDPISGSTIKEGDVKLLVCNPIDVVHDFRGKNPFHDQWLIIKEVVNKFDEAAAIPHKASEIVNLTNDITNEAIYDFNFSYEERNGSQELINKYTFLHERTPALPNGRMTQFFKDSNNTYVFDGPLPYRHIPKIRVCPSEELNGKFGRSNSKDMLSMQDVLDGMVSTAVTNLTTTSINNLWMKKSDSFSYDELASGTGIIKSETKPEALILNKANPQVLEFANFVINRMQAYSGVNSVARGNVDKQLSGSAMALIQSMTLEFNSGLEAAWTKSIEQVSTIIIQHLQKFVVGKRLAAIAGKNRSYMTRYFTKDDLSVIDRVSCQLGNPLSKTPAGRLELADKYLSAGMITNADEYNQVLLTGRLDPVIEAPENRAIGMRAENEELLAGRMVKALWSDNHQKHFMTHISLLDNPENRSNPQLIAMVTAHVLDHLQKWKTTPPELLTAIGVPPIPPTPMLPLPIDQGPAINPSFAEQSDSKMNNDMIKGAGVPTQPINLSNVMQPPQSKPNIRPVQKPNMPKNPMTGERVNQPEFSLSN